MKKIIKITKIFLVLLTIFSQLSPAATALADEIVDNYESVENSKENVKSLAINGHLNYNEGEITKSLDGEMNSDNLVIYNVNAKVYTQILTISGDEIEDDVEYSVKVNDNEILIKKDYGFENDYSDPDITSLKTLDGGVNIYAILTY